MAARHHNNMIRFRNPGLLLSLSLLAACTAPPAPQPVPRLPAIPVAKPGPGTARVLGRTPDVVLSVLGRPTLDRSEGPARQLQFSGKTCVADIFFYPDRRGGLAATHIEARDRSGRVVDPGGCIEALVAR